MQSDCATVYALAIKFGLLDVADRKGAGDRLAELVRDNGFRNSTGFAGTSFVTDAPTSTGHLDAAYRLLLEQKCPSWLYPVTMGATTVWERWDSMLPDGTIIPGEMTGFNHYALGAVADWMHRIIGGITSLEPGSSRVSIAPQPGGNLAWAKVAVDSPHGRIAAHWSLDDTATLRMQVEVPVGVTAVVRIPGIDAQEVGVGTPVFTSH